MKVWFVGSFLGEGKLEAKKALEALCTTEGWETGGDPKRKEINSRAKKAFEDMVAEGHAAVHMDTIAVSSLRKRNAPDRVASVHENVFKGLMEVAKGRHELFVEKFRLERTMTHEGELADAMHLSVLVFGASALFHSDRS